MISTLMGSLCRAAVASSHIVIWKPPSPTMAQTFLSGLANCAPMAAGTPKPMVPAPPEDIQCRFLVVRQNCAAHIWCWPTSVVMMQSRPPSLSSRSSTCCALRPPFLAYLSGYCLRQAAICLSHSLESQRLDQREQVLDHQPGVALEADVGPHDLAELGPVDVDVDLDRVGAELRQLAGDAVVPARADGHDERRSR